MSVSGCRQAARGDDTEQPGGGLHGPTSCPLDASPEQRRQVTLRWRFHIRFQLLKKLFSLENREHSHVTSPYRSVTNDRTFNDLPSQDVKACSCNYVHIICVPAYVYVL